MDNTQYQFNTRDRASSNQLEQEKESTRREAHSPSKPPLPSSSSSSSPSHDFSFKVSLLPADHKNRATAAPPPPPSSSTAVLDLSPADDIFFHGHLLPLHLLSHLPPVSPRLSTNSLDGFALPAVEDSAAPPPDRQSQNPKSPERIGGIGAKESLKSKSLSLFGLARWRKGCEIGEEKEKQRKRKKPRFDLSQVLKRYMTMVRPLLLFRRRRKDNAQIRRQAFSFSGTFSPRATRLRQERRAEFSAPASMRASPTNSGLLFATAAAAAAATATLPSPACDSTMEELQAAIQAAIAHCKNSIAQVEDKLNCQ